LPVLTLSSKWTYPAIFIFFPYTLFGRLVYTSYDLTQGDVWFRVFFFSLSHLCHSVPISLRFRPSLRGATPPFPSFWPFLLFFPSPILGPFPVFRPPPCVLRGAIALPYYPFIPLSSDLHLPLRSGPPVPVRCFSPFTLFCTDDFRPAERPTPFPRVLPGFSEALLGQWSFFSVYLFFSKVFV